MQPPIAAVKLLETIQPLVAYVRESTLHGNIEEAYGALRAAQVCLELYRTPRYAKYDPAELLRDNADALAGNRHMLEIEPLPQCTGDPGQVLTCLQQLIGGAELGEGAYLDIEAFQEDGKPCVALSFNGPGTFPDEISVGGYLPLSLDELGQRWALATRGGRMDHAPNGLIFSFKGLRMAPESVNGLEPVQEAVCAALDNLNRGEDTFDHVEECLEQVEGKRVKMIPASLAVIIDNTVARWAHHLDARGIVIDITHDTAIPSLLLHRDRLHAYFANILRYAIGALPNGGKTAIATLYNPGKHEVHIEAALEGPVCYALASLSGNEQHRLFHIPALRRTIVEFHDGTFTAGYSDETVRITATLPDFIGRAIEETIPGFTAFSPTSQQALRLVETGQGAPPREFLLDGVLSEELEHWLLARLKAPLAKNVAHEIEPTASELPGASVERLEKALGQIRRGKPRKEIVAPSYAAEILWAFGSTERGRTALGTDMLDNDELARLCTALLSKPPKHIQALELIAKMATAQQ